MRAFQETGRPNYDVYQKSTPYANRASLEMKIMKITDEWCTCNLSNSVSTTIKEAATQAACAGNTRGYHSEYGNSWFNNRENDDANYMFRSYKNRYYSSSR